MSATRDERTEKLKGEYHDEQRIVALDQQPEVNDGREPVNTEVSILQRLDRLETADMDDELDYAQFTPTMTPIPIGAAVKTVDGRGGKVTDYCHTIQRWVGSDGRDEYIEQIQYFIEGIRTECFHHTKVEAV